MHMRKRSSSSVKSLPRLLPYLIESVCAERDVQRFALSEAARKAHSAGGGRRREEVRVPQERARALARPRSETAGPCRARCAGRACS
eukprot:6184365-Pleurochrysis_carterae.AAC.2